MMTAIGHLALSLLLFNLYQLDIDVTPITATLSHILSS